jgi:tRNA A58 N-methylase Trm61
MATRKVMAERSTASESFLRAINQMARLFHNARKQSTDESSIQAIEAIRKKQEEHEERKRRISETIAHGARISRNR